MPDFSQRAVSFRGENRSFTGVLYGGVFLGLSLHLKTLTVFRCIDSDDDIAGMYGPIYISRCLQTW